MSNVTKGAKAITDTVKSIVGTQGDTSAETAIGASGHNPDHEANFSPNLGVINIKEKGAAPATNSFLETSKPFFIPIIALIIGAGMMNTEGVADIGKLVLYFGAQSFMNIFMSWVLGTHVTIPAGTTLDNGYTLTKDLKGCPAGFALTALQQVVSFVMFMIFFAAVYYTPHRYKIRQLTTTTEYVSVVVFGCVFAANIALNNFSLGYISIAVNLIIRSCLPLSTYLSQQALSVINLYQRKPFVWLEIALMCVGVICACIFTWADFGGKMKMDAGFIGVLACLGSLLCGSLNLALAGVLGDIKLSVLDTCAYMAIPATVFLLPIIFLFSKPVPGEWTHLGTGYMTDWEIVTATWQYSKSTIAWLFLSGAFSFLYNMCQFNIVHTLSPSATAFGGNFNKAALTFMTLLLPFLQTKAPPAMPYLAYEWLALLCNITAFSYYSYLQLQAKKAAQGGDARTHKKLDEEESDEEEGSETASDE